MQKKIELLKREIEAKRNREGVLGKWFRPRTWCGWGYIPINWKGVIAYIMLFALIILSAIYFQLFTEESSNGIKFLISFILLIIIFSFIANKKTDKTKCEKPSIKAALKKIIIKFIIAILIIAAFFIVFYYFK